jgi:hypothetical protein
VRERTEHPQGGRLNLLAFRLGLFIGELLTRDGERSRPKGGCSTPAARYGPTLETLFGARSKEFKTRGGRYWPWR